MNVYDRVIPNNAIETLMVFAVGVVTVYFLDGFLKFFSYKNVGNCSQKE